MSADPHPWAADLAGLHAQVWTQFTRGLRDRDAPTRHPTLATVTADGLPQARTVVLRAADRRAGSLEFHTDIHSAKVTELRATPFVALHVWDSAAQLQMRLEGDVTILSGDDVAKIWARVPAPARLAYGCTPAPGKPIADGLSYTKKSDPAAFSVLRLRILAMDIVHLGRDHRRARFTRANNWAGQWLAP